MALLIREADVRALLPMGEAIRVVGEAFGRLAHGEATNHPRRRHRVPDGLMHVMDAADPATGFMGLKCYTTLRGGNHFHVLLYSTATGALEAFIEADWLGRLRTGAASGVAAQKFARADSSVVGLIGAGRQAETQLEAMRAVLNVREVRVWSLTRDRLVEFCGRFGATPVAGAREAVAGAHVVVTATTSKDPVLEGAWLEPGQLVIAMGSNHVKRRETDDEAVRRAGLIVTDDVAQAKVESGELISAGVDWSKVKTVGEVSGRADERQIVYFKSNGIALLDVAAGAFVFRRARERGVGERIDVA